MNRERLKSPRKTQKRSGPVDGPGETEDGQGTTKGHVVRKEP